MKINKRKLLLVCADLLIFFASGMLFFLMYRLIGVISSVSGATRVFSSIVVGYTLLSAVAFLFAGEYSKSWKYITYKDYIRCALLLLISTLLTMLASYLVVPLINDRILDRIYVYFISAYLLSAVGVIVLRIIAKRYYLMLIGAQQSGAGKRTIIIGAGNAGRMIAREVHQPMYLSNKKNERYNIVGFLDDDPNKTNANIDGVEVIGKTGDIERICEELNIETIFFAIPSCTDKKKSEILNLCVRTDCDLKVIPEISSLLVNKSVVTQAKKIEVEDLLGRDPIKFDFTAVKENIRGKVCMVTGGGGSIGSELCRQIASFEPKQLIIVDIYENNAYDIQQELVMNYGDSLDLVVLIASVRDRAKMAKIFRTYKPQIVYHAAAHKHVPLMEVSPEESVKNNIFGTLNVAELAEIYEVEKFVMISTDKAVNPTNVMGATKRCCEMVVQALAQNGSGGTEFVAVRFGNVLGSNGSVIPLFKRLIEAGKPLTVTHPDIIRYFMTIPEAVSLVLEAGSMAKGGEIFVLDMGEPVKILDLAENLIRAYGKKPYEDVQIKFTGLRPGEKLYEELLMNEEGLEKTENDKIFIGNQINIKEDEFYILLDKLRTCAGNNDSQKTVDILAQIVPTFNHKLNEKKR